MADEAVAFPAELISGLSAFTDLPAREVEARLRFLITYPMDEGSAP